jgi:hypothetical protein
MSRASIETQNLNDIYDKVAEHLGVSKAKVRMCVEHKYRCFADVMRSMSNEAILDNQFGVFYLIPKKMMRTIQRLEEKESLSPREAEVLDNLKGALDSAKDYQENFKR